MRYFVFRGMPVRHAATVVGFFALAGASVQAWTPRAQAKLNSQDISNRATLPSSSLPSSFIPGSSLSRFIPTSSVLSHGKSGTLPSVPGLVWSAERGTPAFVEARALRMPSPSDWQGFSSLAGARTLALMQANRELFRLMDPPRELRLSLATYDRLGSRHEVFQQYHDGIPIWGGQINAHYNRSGMLYSMNGAYARTPELRPLKSWRIGQNDAIGLTLHDLSQTQTIEDLSPDLRVLLDYPAPLAEKNVWRHPETHAAHWAWRIEVRPNFVDRWRYFIDAATGEILEKYNTTNTDGPKTASARDLLGITRTINTYQVGTNHYLIDGTRKAFNTRANLPGSPQGALWTMTASNTDLTRLTQVTSANNTWNDATAVSAHYNLSRIYEYFLNTFNRQGIDGVGGNMISVVHVTMNGAAMDNAYWNGRVMAYGNGSRVFKPLARALDVAGHEMTHGIIDATVGLVYRYQSGALNESLADIFGAMIDRDDWKMGEDVINSTAYTNGALRSLEDPHNGGRKSGDPGWQPKHMLEFLKLTLANDNGGVHINSGIPNHACYLIAQAIGREKTEQIYYRVLEARYLNPNSQFIDMRIAAVRAATDLYGETSPEVIAVRNGFTAVGIGNATTSDIPTPKPPDRPPIEGEAYVVMVGAKPGDTALYVAKANAQSEAEVTALSRTQVYAGSGKPVAVTPDGALTLFIDTKHALRSVDATGEKVVNAGNWKSVAITPDGTTAALTKLQADAKIHLLDLKTGALRAINLYTPSTGQETQSNTVVYADAIEFNSTGETVVYDCLNRVTLTDGSPIEFWTANLLDVASGIITPFMSNFPTGVSIGNPSFAQTNDLNVVFDLIDESTGSFSVVAADLHTGSYRVIDSMSPVPGGPRYSTRDDKIIFTKRASNALGIYQLALNKDKISPSGRAISFMANYQKPIWFTRGTRPSALPDVNAMPSSSITLNWKAASGITLSLNKPSHLRLSAFGTQGQNLGEIWRGKKPAGQYQFPWQAPASGQVWLRLEAQPEGSARQVLVRGVSVHKQGLQ